MAKKKTTKSKKQIETIRHDDASRRNIPTAEFQSVVPGEVSKPVPVAYPRTTGGDSDPLASEKEARNRDLDPQLVWRGKDEQDASDLVVHAPPLYIQEKVHPKVLVDDLRRRTQAAEIARKLAAGETADPFEQMDLFADFNGIPDHADAKTEFYEHDANWTNRMILGDSLQVMASLAEREGLRGKVQCIYFDPPYGIKFNSNFQWSTTSRDVKDGKSEHITREPEMVRAFRDTWKDGIHSYLSYLRDRLTVARDLLHESGSVFVQIGDENVHRVRMLMDEIFGDTNFISLITVAKTTSSTNGYLSGVADYVLWFAKNSTQTKYRRPYSEKAVGESGAGHYTRVLRTNGSSRPATKAEKAGVKPLDEDDVFYTTSDLQSASMGREKGEGAASWFPVEAEGRVFRPSSQTRWKTSEQGMLRLQKANRVIAQKQAIRYLRRIDDFAAYEMNNIWNDLGGATDKRYVVETSPRLVARCILMATDPGDLVIDPTCGSGTTAAVAEQWGRRWITIDTSRVALALARARIMGAKYPYYLLADSAEGLEKEAEISRTDPPRDLASRRFAGSVRQGFVYERVPHIMLKNIASNSEIDTIYEKLQPAVDAALADLNEALKGHGTPFTVATGGRAKKKIDFTDKPGTTVKLPSGEGAPANCMLEWEVPREAPEDWPAKAQKPLEAFWKARIRRQKEIDASIAAKAEFEYLYDKPYEDKKKVRVAGPFTVESISPHRTLGVDENDELIDPAHPKGRPEDEQDFVTTMLETLKAAGVQQASKEDRIEFSSLTPWPGNYICAEGRYTEGEGDSEVQKRAGIFIGPEFGTVSRQDLVTAAREAGDADFDVLIACAFSYDALSSEFNKLGRIPVLKARMNADLHMAGELKNTGKGNLFVVFGEPDIEILDASDEGLAGDIKVQINGVDVFDPAKGEVRSDSAEGIACWFIDTDYNEESFFVRHAYFLGQNDPYKSLKTTLKAEIDQDAWETLNSDVSRPFNKPKSGKIAVKVINHLGDEVMKVFRVE